MHQSKSNQHCRSLWRILSNRLAGRHFKRTWYQERRYRWWQKLPVGMAGSWPGGLQAQARIPISRFVLQKDSENSGYYSLCSRPRWGPIKDLGLWCFNPWLFGRKKTPLLWTRWCLLHAGSSQAVLLVPPVVLITVHDEGMQWSGRREESRGDPRCSARVGEGGGRKCMFARVDHKWWTTLFLTTIVLPLPPPLFSSHTIFNN